jgi:hypothetical protein
MMPGNLFLRSYFFRFPFPARGVSLRMIRYTCETDILNFFASFVPGKPAL